MEGLSRGPILTALAYSNRTIGSGCLEMPPGIEFFAQELIGNCESGERIFRAHDYQDLGITGSRFVIKLKQMSWRTNSA